MEQTIVCLIECTCTEAPLAASAFIALLVSAAPNGVPKNALVTMETKAKARSLLELAQQRLGRRYVEATLIDLHE
jgi:hypothetical protein